MQVFSGTDFRLLRSFGSLGSRLGEFNYPWDLAVAPSGLVYTVEHYNHRVQIWTPEGEALATWGEFGSQPGQFQYPCGIFVSPAEEVYVVERATNHNTVNHRVQVFTLDGQYLRGWGNRGKGAGEFDYVSAVFVSVLLCFAFDPLHPCMRGFIIVCTHIVTVNTGVQPGLLLRLLQPPHSSLLG